MRAAILAVLLAASVALTGCGPARQTPAERGPSQVTPADVQQREDEVADIERVVGSAESETANDG